jgi:hypothetical protein
MEAERCSETLEQATFSTQSAKPKNDHIRLDKIAVSLKRSHPINFSDSSITYTFMPFRRAISPAHLIHFDLIIVVRLNEAYYLLRPFLCNFLPTHIISSPASVEFSSSKSKTISVFQ